MSFERSPGTGAEHATPVVGAAATASEPTPVQIRLQILSTEHWSLLASRSLAWNEVFSRASTYLATLSASIVALGLIGGIDGFGDAFFAFAFVVLPVVLFLGVATWTRLASANHHDAMTVIGMNRIRAGYLQIAPDLEPFFVMGIHDDPPGIAKTMAVIPQTPMVIHIISSTPFLITMMNAVVSGAIAALALGKVSDAGVPLVVLGGLLFGGVVLVAQMSFAGRNIRAAQQAVQPLFPTPKPAEPAAADRPGA